MSDRTDPARRRRRVTDQAAEDGGGKVPSIDSLLEHVVKRNASDLHIASGGVPTMRVEGELVAVPGMPALSSEVTERPKITQAV